MESDANQKRPRPPTDKRIARATHLIGCRCPETRGCAQGPRLYVGKGRRIGVRRINGKVRYRAKKRWDLVDGT